MTYPWAISLLGVVLGLIYNVNFPDGGTTRSRMFCQWSVIGMMGTMYWLGRVAQ